MKATQLFSFLTLFKRILLLCIVALQFCHIDASQDYSDQYESKKYESEDDSKPFRMLQATTPTIVQDSTTYPIFKPIPVYTTSSTESCAKPQNSFILSFTALNTNFVIISLKTCGFKVMNVQNPQQPVLEFSSTLDQFDGEVQKFTQDSSRNVIWVAHSSGNVLTIDISKRPFSFSGTIQTSQLVQPYFVEFIPNLNNVILIVCYSQIQVFKSSTQSTTISALQYYRTVALTNLALILKIQFTQNLNVLFVGSYAYGLNIYTLQNGSTADFTLTQVNKIQPRLYNLGWFEVVDNQNKLILQMQYSSIYVYDLTACLLNASASSCSSLTLKQYIYIASKAGQFVLNKAKTFLYTQYRAFGLYIVDISQPSLITFETISINGDVQSLALSADENYLFYSDTFNFFIFERCTQSLNTNQPNILLNIMQAMDNIAYRQDPPPYTADPSCIYDDKRQLLYLSRQQRGLTILKKQSPGIMTVVYQLDQAVANEQISMIVFFNDNTIAYVAKGVYGLSIMDFTNPAAPVYIQQNINFGIPNISSLVFVCNTARTYCIYPQVNLGVLFIDVSNYNNPVLKSIFKTNSYDISNTYSSGAFLNTKQVVIISVFYYGILVVDFTDPTNPIQLSLLFTNEADQLMVSSDEKYCMCTSSYQGMLVVDISDLKNLKIISSVQLFGAVYAIGFISNEQYILVTSFEKSAFFLIDVQDKMNPTLVQTYKRIQNEGIFGYCLDSQENEGFLSTAGPFIMVNMKNQVILHVETYRVIQQQNPAQQTFLSLNQEESLNVGSQIQMYIIPLYVKSQLLVKSAQLYENYVMQPLKSWMVYSADTGILTLDISKDALSQNQQGNFIATSQTIIFNVYTSLVSTSFVNTYLGITAAISANILAELQRTNYIDSINMVSPNFGPYTQLNINFSNMFPASFTLTPTIQSQVVSSIMYVLQHSVVLYPITFTVVPSLTFDLQNSVNHIFSIQNTISVVISITQAGQGYFVNKNYQGVLSLISEQGNEINIQGDIEKVNWILSQKIKFFSSIPSTQISFNIQISDSVNYDIIQIVSYQDATFISEQHQVEVKSGFTLQNDFSSKLQDSSISIQERFQYSISPDLFVSDSGYPLTYSAQMEIGGKYIQIPANHWLSFSATDRVFSGTPGTSSFNTVIRLQVNVTDSYSYVTQTMYININQVPAAYILQILFQVLGPIIGILGVWKYQYYVYNMMFQKEYSYSKEVTLCGMRYSKQILLNNNNIQDAEKILVYFQSCISDKEIEKQIYSMYTNVKDIKVDNLKKLQKQEMIIKRLNDFTATFSEQQNPQPFQQQQQQQQQINQSNVNVDSDQIEIQLNQTEKGQQQSQQLQQQNQPSSQQNKFSNLNIVVKNTFETIKDQQVPTQQETKSPVAQDSNFFIFSKKQLNFESPKPVGSQEEMGSPVDDPNLNRKSTLHNFPRLSQCQTNDSKIQRRRISSSSKIISKSLKTQIRRITQYQSEKNLSQQQPDKIKETVVINLKDPKSQVSSQDFSSLQIFDIYGNINYNNIIEFMINKNKIITQTKKQHLSDYQIGELLNQQGLVRQTFEGILAEYILQKDAFSYSILTQLHNIQSIPEKIPDWYKAYCEIRPDLDNIQLNPLPVVVFKEEDLVRCIRQYLFGFNQNFFNQCSIEELPVSFNIIKQVIKAYALGFISCKAKLKPISYGESLKTSTHNIKLITSQERSDENKRDYAIRLLNQLKQKFQNQFKEKPLIDNSKLPSWIKSVDITNNNLLIIGSPERKDIGSYFIYIYSKRNYILRCFEIEVVSLVSDRAAVTTAVYEQRSRTHSNQFNNSKLNLRNEETNFFSNNQINPITNSQNNFVFDQQNQVITNQFNTNFDNFNSNTNENSNNISQLYNHAQTDEVKQSSHNIQEDEAKQPHINMYTSEMC